jgi:hypothetical protein
MYGNFPYNSIQWNYPDQLFRRVTGNAEASPKSSNSNSPVTAITDVYAQPVTMKPLGLRPPGVSHPPDPHLRHLAKTARRITRKLTHVFIYPQANKSIKHYNNEHVTTKIRPLFHNRKNR